MFESDRMSVDDFFDWHQTVEGRYELVDGRIVPHPDFVTPQGLAAPTNAHAAILANLVVAFGAQLQPPCRTYVGAGVKVNRASANIPDFAVSCDPADRGRKALENPLFICEILSTRTHRTDTTRKVGDYLALPSVAAYLVIDGERRTVTVHRADTGPQTWDEASTIRLTGEISIAVSQLIA